jgi:hypothetical protein
MWSDDIWRILDAGRMSDDPSKAPAFLKSFEADPTIEGPPVPAKS